MFANGQTRENYGHVTDEMGRSPEERRAAFDNSETIQITGDEIFDWAEPLKMKEIRGKVVPWMKERGYLRGGYINGDRRRFYDHELTEIKNLDGRPSQGGADGSGTGAAFRTHQDTGHEPDSIINIVQNGLAVNTQGKKLSDATH